MTYQSKAEKIFFLAVPLKYTKVRYNTHKIEKYAKHNIAVSLSFDSGLCWTIGMSECWGHDRGRRRDWTGKVQSMYKIPQVYI